MRWCLETLVERVGAAMSTHGAKLALFTGYTANLDRIIALECDEFAKGRLRTHPEALASRLETAKYCEIRDVVDVWRGLWEQLGAGKGGEWVLDDRATFARLRDVFDGRLGLGGSGAQAADVLGALGLHPVLNIPVGDPRLLALLSPNVRVPLGRGLVAPERASVTGDRATTHFIFEYAAGFWMSVAGRTLTARQRDRLIVPYDPERREFAISGAFSRASTKTEGPKALLVSGYNVPGGVDVTSAALSATEAHLDAFVSDAAFVHLEIGESHSLPARRAVVSRLFPRVHSVGLNEDELIVLAGDLGKKLPHREAIDQVINVCLHIALRFTLARLNLHTTHYALAVSRFPVELERAAMAFGNATAAYRAMHGATGTLDQIRAAVKQLPLSGRGQSMCEAWDPSAEAGVRDRGEYNLVLLPAFEAVPQRQAVGLGDTYAAAVLAVHALANANGDVF